MNLVGNVAFHPKRKRAPKRLKSASPTLSTHGHTRVNP